VDTIEILGPDIEGILGIRTEGTGYAGRSNSVLVPSGKVAMGTASSIYCCDRAYR
jgi:hypothetical protein